MFLIITPTHTRIARATWCHFCLGKQHAGMCKPLVMAMEGPPVDDPLPDQPGDQYPGIDYEPE